MSEPRAQPSYADLLRWMQTVVTHPRTAATGALTPEAQAVVPGPAEAIDGVILPSAKLTGLERLAVYARSYHARLRECLETDHGALWYALGLVRDREEARDDLITELLSAYVTEHPSTAYSLDRFGDALPEFLASSSALALTRLGSRQFFADLARLERLMVDNFHLPAPTPMRPEDLQGLSPEEILESTLTFTSGVTLVACSYPAHTFLHDWAEDRNPPIPASAPEYVLFHRKGFHVWRAPLQRAGYALLRALEGGRTVGRALEIAMRVAGDEADSDPDGFVEKVFESFRGWSEDGLFAGLRAPPTRH